MIGNNTPSLSSISFSLEQPIRISILPRSVVDLMRHLGPIEEHPLMMVDTYLACRPGFATLAFSEFRKTLERFSDIKDGSKAKQS
ncbi:MULTISPECIES: hypothetical protein [unclassified Chelatococcus]|uniref:hypothetical protein n=1 Tax=unclassified Chelatococcus TaxID=2638111 RepID=UPI001BCF4C73|nr:MULTISPECIES: hypothetical protein [unclassified Chelatococcus]MBS7741782.1 hypothetical protein [Chelatococcus sp. HY11]MBX3541420.1 hypothetical protein [Chelatococcus sp.]MCO5074686.1 hypothetical protein [Chelatococcus sp.]